LLILATNPNKLTAKTTLKMKYLGFIFMFLLAVVLGSCSDKDVTYPMTPVDENAKAYVQINYVVPLSNVVANRIYKIDLNHQEYVNNSSALMSPYGQYPGGSVFFTVDAGNVEVKLYRNDSTVVYDQLVSLEGGKHYNVFVYDLNKAPAIIDRGEIPTFPVTDSTCTLSNVKLYNFLFEADGTPSTDKVQLVLRGVKSGSTTSPWARKWALARPLHSCSPTLCSVVMWMWAILPATLSLWYSMDKRVRRKVCCNIKRMPAP
jgi:hypothetical protein